MICKVCLGKGWILNKNYTERIECPACHGTKETEPTNEDWFCSLSTKEKAEWINNKMLEAYHDGRNGWTPRFSKIKTEKWLREKHDDNI